MNLQGFTLTTSDIKPRLIVSASGREKHGKSSFGFSAPGPIAYFNFDFGDEGVIQKFTSSKQIYTKQFKFSRGQPTDKYITMWEDFIQSYHQAMDHSQVRSVLIDTATEAWELLRLARFGRLAQIKPFHYGPVNAEYTALIREAYDSTKNLILLHKLKPEYVDDKFTGNYIPAGFSNTGFLVQVNVDLYRDGYGGDFFMRIRDCRQNALIGGEELPVFDISETFNMLAGLVFSDIDAEMWR